MIVWSTISRRGRMTDSFKSVTMQDIASRVGVHRSTVQRALVGDPRIDATTVKRVRAEAVRLGYDPAVNQAARRLSLRRTGRAVSNHLVALFFPSAVFFTP